MQAVVMGVCSLKQGVLSRAGSKAKGISALSISNLAVLGLKS